MLAPFTPPPITTTSAVWVIAILLSPPCPSLPQPSPRTAALSPRGEREKLSLDRVTRVDSVAPAVPEKVEARYGQGDRDPGEDGDPRRRGEIALSVVEHVTPACERRLDAVAEEADVRLEQNGSRHAEGGRHRDDAHRVGQEVAQHDTSTRSAEAPRALDELALSEGEHLAAHHARHVHPRGDADDEGHGSERRRHEGGQGEKQEDGRKGQHGVRDAEEDRIGGAAEVAGQRAEERAE